MELNKPELADDVEQAEVRRAALTELYRYLAIFVADNLTHMNQR